MRFSPTASAGGGGREERGSLTVDPHRSGRAWWAGKGRLAHGRSLHRPEGDGEPRKPRLFLPDGEPGCRGLSRAPDSPGREKGASRERRGRKDEPPTSGGGAPGLLTSTLCNSIYFRTVFPKIDPKCSEGESSGLI